MLKGLSNKLNLKKQPAFFEKTPFKNDKNYQIFHISSSYYQLNSTSFNLDFILLDIKQE